MYFNQIEKNDNIVENLIVSNNIECLIDPILLSEIKVNIMKKK